ncbi:S-adenosyl-L-methionine-dependent methyltransferase [Lophiostoma macrostomum CBS 122681]|uniref:Histone-lysine N-methyltransferase, H3 lysine-79 specific n=1 Tax=Lophiostoma macrostomum CBS 122681 TaxID=1314788 RepID=A0A6A6TBY4_9PLEO|nr:S-adenosyl-L-methionine-dependent methyltransferase [Lophiostoma macrostomum CBS 122681]
MAATKPQKTRKSTTTTTTTTAKSASAQQKIYLRINFKTSRITKASRPALRLKLNKTKWRSASAIRLLNAAYTSTISPLVAALAHETSLSSKTTYGELTPTFVASMLAEFNVTKRDTFVDLGSGVGNVALQAHLATGCAALGCELDAARHAAALEFKRTLGRMLEAPPRGLDVAGLGSADELQERVELVCGDVFADAATIDAVDAATLIFSANLKFGPVLVEAQVDFVLARMKPGAVFVSLEKVVRGTRTGCRRTLEALGVREEKRVSGEWAVSWTDKPIRYWVYTRE